jgi:hypothetical protein
MPEEENGPGNQRILSCTPAHRKTWAHAAIGVSAQGSLDQPLPDHGRPSAAAAHQASEEAQTLRPDREAGC